MTIPSQHRIPAILYEAREIIHIKIKFWLLTNFLQGILQIFQKNSNILVSATKQKKLDSKTINKKTTIRLLQIYNMYMGNVH